MKHIYSKKRKEPQLFFVCILSLENMSRKRDIDPFTLTVIDRVKPVPEKSPPPDVPSVLA